MANELLEAARQVAYFDGPTPENLKRLRDAVADADNRERDHPSDDDEEDDEDDDEGEA